MIQPAAVHMVLPGNDPPWTDTGIHVCRGDRRPRVSPLGPCPGWRRFGCTQDTTTVAVDRSGPLQRCVYLGAWADRSGRWSRCRTAAGCEPGRRTHRALSPIADPWLATAERRLLHPVVPPAGWSYLLAAGPAGIYRSALAEGRPLIEIVCDDDVGIIGGAAYATSARSSPRARCERPARAELQRWTTPSTAPSPVTALRCGSAGGDESRARCEADDERFVGPAPARIRSLRLVTVSHFGHGTGAGHIPRHRRPHRRRTNSGAPTASITSEVIDWPTVAGRRSPCHVRP